MLAVYTWQDGALRPTPRFAKVCSDKFEAGKRYQLETVEERSAASHRAYFAYIREVWLNLPEELSVNFLNEDHLRKYALIKCGFREERSIVVGSSAEAQHVAAFIRPMDEFAVITVSGPVVTAYTAKSQSYRSMDKDEFKRSQEAVRNYLATLIGSEPNEIERNAGKAA